MEEDKDKHGGDASPEQDEVAGKQGRKLRWGKDVSDDENTRGASTSRRPSTQSGASDAKPGNADQLNTPSLPESHTARPQSPRHAEVAAKKGAVWKENCKRKPRDPSGAKKKQSPRKGTDSLTVPGGPVKEHSRTDAMSSRDNLSSSGNGNAASETGSRKSSVRSLESRLSGVDMSKFANAAATGNGKSDSEQEQQHAPGAESYIRSVIPFLPRSAAAICLILNTFTPGIGTMVSGLLAFCGVGKTRVQSKDDSRSSTLCVNVMVGFMQLSTVSFMLVGWFWSFVWGIYMIILSIEYNKKEKEKHEKELQAKALTALNANIRPWSLV